VTGADPGPAPRRARRDAAAPGGRRAIVVLMAVTVLLAAATAADLLAQPAPPPPAEPLAQPPASAGTWYCPAVAGEGERAVVTISAVGDEPSQVVVDRYAEGRAVPDEPRTIDAGGEAVLELTGADARAPVAVRWSGGPVAAVWRVDGERTASAACEPAPAERWLATGFTTTLGSRSTIHLFNPFTADAVVRLVFATPDGPVRLVLTDNILVPAGGTSTRNLGRFQPEIPDLGVIVEVLAGRVVAQGEMRVDPPRGTSGASGRTLIPAAPETSKTWAVAYAAASEGTESWLSVLNPGEREAAVEVRVSAPSDEGTGLIGEVSVPAGGVARVELAGVSVNPEFGVSVTVVNDEPVVVTRMTSLRLGGREALTGGLAAAGLDTEWALLGGGAGDRAGLVSVYNPGADEATVDIVADGAPAAWSGITLGPNGRAKVLLAEAGPDRASIPVRVSSDAPVVAGLRSTSAGERLRLWLTTGVPAQLWIGPLTRPAVRFDPSLSTRRAETPAAADVDDLAPQLDDLDDTATEAPDASATEGR
jgi:hypothetical protein